MKEIEVFNRQIAKFEKVKQELATMDDVIHVKRIRDEAGALRVLAKSIGAGLESQNRCAEIKIRAERKAGELLKAKLRDPGYPDKILHDEISLKDVGVSLIQSFRWRLINKIPPKEFEDFIQNIIQAERELTSIAIFRFARQLIKAETPPMPTDRYRIIYADPPWSYGNVMPIEYVTEQAHHYSLMKLDELLTIPIEDIVENDAVLFLWATSPILEEAFDLINGWGFDYKASFIWDKIKHNMGHYNSVRHEFLLIATKGSCLPDNAQLFDSVISIERGRHSEKPEYFREIIDTLYSNGKRIELFSREKIEGWDSWGSEI